MKRDMDLIRSLLLKLEEIEGDGTAIYILEADAEEIQVQGFTSGQIGYHLSLLQEAGLIVPSKKGTMTGGVMFQRLSWSGHDLIDSVRDPEVWNKTKQGAKAVGGLTLELFKDLAVGFLKKKVEDHTGVKI